MLMRPSWAPEASISTSNPGSASQPSWRVGAVYDSLCKGKFTNVIQIYLWKHQLLLSNLHHRAFYNRRFYLQIQFYFECCFRITRFIFIQELWKWGLGECSLMKYLHSFWYIIIKTQSAQNEVEYEMMHIWKQLLKQKNIKCWQNKLDIPDFFLFWIYVYIKNPVPSFMHSKCSHLTQKGI